MLLSMSFQNYIKYSYFKPIFHISACYRCVVVRHILHCSPEGPKISYGSLIPKLGNRSHNKVELEQSCLAV